MVNVELESGLKTIVPLLQNSISNQQKVRAVPEVENFTVDTACPI